MKKYQPQDFEQKWSRDWEKKQIYQTDELTKDKKKMYTLVMFPYPSGTGLHIGHVRVYTGTDVLARYFRMNNYAVLNPMGWDAFGLPAENAAVKANKNPQDMVPKNIANFKRQMKMLGLSYDWNRELSTTDPEYYKITQWLFIQFFKLGLLYKKQTPVYFCPSCQTGLSEEEVLSNGNHERCNKPITKKLLPQWIFSITEYADSLLKTLGDLDWPKGILEMQKNWIGKKQGTEIKFSIFKDQFSNGFKTKDITVFTTRADTIYGITALVIAPEHCFVNEILEKGTKEIKNYVEKAKAKSDIQRTDLAKEKTGVNTGFFAIHPLTNEKIPIWIADYVVGWYGKGAVMLVPAHDKRDFEFAKKYKIKIKKVVVDLGSRDNQPLVNNNNLRQPLIDYGVLINSEKFSGLKSKEAIKKITKYLEKKRIGSKKNQYHLRDWIFSRQRYWGEPIPIVYCQRCADSKISFFETNQFKNWILKVESLAKNNQSTTKLHKTIQGRVAKTKDSLYGWFPISDDQLPLKLPHIKSYKPTKTGKSPLAELKDWVKTTCPQCGGTAKRETDTMPNWAGSCWYFLRFASEEVKNEKLKVKSLKKNLFENWELKIENYGKWLPVDWYIGGAEHAVLHLLYARFWIHILNDMGLVDFREPFLRLRNVGMVLAEDHRKMSKSFGNVINPDDIIASNSADALRVYEMFMAPFSQEVSWSIKTLRGSSRFLSRIWQIYNSSDYITNIENEEDKELVVKLHKTIYKVTQDITNVKFNTAIAAMMEFINSWEKSFGKRKRKLSLKHAKEFLQVLAPFAPFMTEEIWKNVFKKKDSIHRSLWPQVKKENIQEEWLTIPIQIDGKLRTSLIVNQQEVSKDTIVKKALKEEKVKKHLQGKKYKVIYIKRKILNFVIL